MADDGDVVEGCLTGFGGMILVIGGAIVLCLVVAVLGIPLGLGVVAGGLEGAGRWFGQLWRVCNRPLTMASSPAFASDETLP